MKSKKTYVAPTIEVIPLKMRSQILIRSIDSNVGITGTGEYSYEILEGDIR